MAGQSMPVCDMMHRATCQNKRAMAHGWVTKFDSGVTHFVTRGTGILA